MLSWSLTRWIIRRPATTIYPSIAKCATVSVGVGVTSPLAVVRGGGIVLGGGKIISKPVVPEGGHGVDTHKEAAVVHEKSNFDAKTESIILKKTEDETMLGTKVGNHFDTAESG